MSDKERPEAKILEAAIDCINDDGVQGVTVRRIAERAGVNVAAINYYYRSKDRLVDAAMEQTMHNAFDDWMEIIRDRKRPIRTRYRDILYEMVWGIASYPGITRAHLYGPIVEGAADTLATGWFSRFFELVSEETTASLPRVEPRVIQAALMELFATALLVPLVRPMFGKVQPFDFTDEQGRGMFVEHLLDTFFRTLGDKHAAESLARGEIGGG